MAFCPNCGTPNTESAEKCVSCAHDLHKPQGKSKFKGTIMMTAPSPPQPEAPPAEGGAGAPAEPTPAPPPGSAPPAAAPPKGAGFQKTVLGPMVAPPVQPPPGQPPPGQPDPGSTQSAPPEPTAPTPAAAPPSALEDLGRAETLAQPAPDLSGARAAQPAAASAHEAQAVPETATGPQANAATEAGGAASAGTGPSAGGASWTTDGTAVSPPKSDTTRALLFGCAGVLVVGCIVGGWLLYAAKQKVEDLMVSGEEALEWQASVISSLRQIAKMCQTDCQNAAIYFHPKVQALMVPEAKSLDDRAVAALGDPERGTATMLDATEDIELATKLGLDPAQCVRITAGAAKVVGCGVPNPSGGGASLRIVHLEGLASL